MTCPICNDPMKPVFEALVLGRHRAVYQRCGGCGLIQPTEPHWLDEAYGSAIAATDVGLVSRNLRNADLLAPVLSLLHPADAPLLDVGGGYGLLCRLLRDRGWDCHTTDAHCTNLFARHFEPGPDFQTPTLMAFEVFEHILEPLAFVRDAIARHGARTFIFSTLTHDWEVPPRDWWYYTFETGQHVSLYRQQTLDALAARIGWHHVPLSAELHLLTANPPGRATRFLLDRRHRIVARAFRTLANLRRQGRSLMMSDYEAIKSEVVREQLAKGDPDR